jgi:hypothetical protein
VGDRYLIDVSRAPGRARDVYKETTFHILHQATTRAVTNATIRCGRLLLAV